MTQPPSSFPLNRARRAVRRARFFVCSVPSVPSCSTPDQKTIAFLDHKRALAAEYFPSPLPPEVLHQHG